MSEMAPHNLGRPALSSISTMAGALSVLVFNIWEWSSLQLSLPCSVMPPFTIFSVPASPHISLHSFTGFSGVVLPHNTHHTHPSTHTLFISLQHPLQLPFQHPISDRRSPIVTQATCWSSAYRPPQRSIGQLSSERLQPPYIPVPAAEPCAANDLACISSRLQYIYDFSVQSVLPLMPAILLNS